MNQDKFSDLIGSIYDCTIDPALWPTALEGICAAVDSFAASIIIADFVTGRLKAAATVGVPAEAMVVYEERFRCSEFFIHNLVLHDIDSPARMLDLVSHEELVAGRAFREWAEPLGMMDTLQTPLMKQQGRMAFIVLARHVTQVPYTDEDQALMRLIAPHVRRAVTIADLIGHKELERDRFLSTLDSLATATLLVDRSGRILYTNRAAETLLQSNFPFAPRAGILEATDEALGPAFRKACGSDEASTLQVTGEQGAMRVTTMPLVGGRRLQVAGGSSCLAVFIQDAVATAPLGAEVIGRTFNLTAAELRVLLGLVDGATPKQIAAQYGLALDTVKSQLKSLFAKTGARRQAELVKLAVGAAPVVQPFH